MGRRCAKKPPMQWSDAINLIQSCGARMTALYGGPVFDEWAILKLDGTATVAYYTGPRPSIFMEKFARDAAVLEKESAGRRYASGEFEFARDSEGTSFDAFLALGGGFILVCNNVQSSMTGIRANPRWLKAQVPFVELTERFRTDPLPASAR